MHRTLAGAKRAADKSKNPTILEFPNGTFSSDSFPGGYRDEKGNVSCVPVTRYARHTGWVNLGRPNWDKIKTR